MTSKEKPSRKNPLARRNGKPIKVWVTEDERQALIQRAEEQGLSWSAYLRKSAMEKEPYSCVNLEALQELKDLNEEFSKMGYLLKDWLHTRNPKTVTGLELEGVMKKCSEIQTEMVSVMSRVAK